VNRGPVGWWPTSHFQFRQRRGCPRFARFWLTWGSSLWIENDRSSKSGSFQSCVGARAIGPATAIKRSRELGSANTCSCREHSSVVMCLTGPWVAIQCPLHDQRTPLRLAVESSRRTTPPFDSAQGRPLRLRSGQAPSAPLRAGCLPKAGKHGAPGKDDQSNGNTTPRR
jgi:hypothetical protein